MLSEAGFAPSVAHIHWQRKGRHRDDEAVERHTGHARSFHEQVGTDRRRVGRGQGALVVGIGSHVHDGHIHRSDGVVGYVVDIRHGHVADTHEEEGDGRSIHCPEGKSDVQGVESENGRTDHCVGFPPEAVIIVSLL